MENQPIASVPVTAPAATPPPPTEERKIAPPLPDSPLLRAKMESEGRIPQHNELQDRSTMVAFGLLFVLPILIILFSALLLLPYINAQLSQDSEPGGAIVQTGPNLPPPTRE
ncbi:hypothetical protein EON83_03550 [bacterium]|nr:MAG: hypothetical protein EON83_03550 [bacterium]